MCPGNGTIQCALGIRLSNVCWLANVPWEWDYPMCPENGTIQCALGMGQSNVPWKRTSQCALGMGLANEPREWG